ncbi:MAG: ribosomal protein S18-alanine N-acetyltransferase [Gammaproteobacteria bacterium]|nr:ribosomal protein S18-alanine N-acetyltransferase [Gammaproteobacteria bacterium]
MRRTDLQSVVSIEQSAYDFPWTVGIFRDCMRTGYICRVCEGEEGVVGYGIMSVAGGECHILNVCIDKNWQNFGLGTRLLNHLMDVGRQQRGRVVFLEVRTSNCRAQSLYMNLGFNEIGERKDYYPAVGGRRENAIVLARNIG